MMENEQQPKGTLAILGAAAVAVVAVLLGVLYWARSEPPVTAQNAPAPESPQAQSPQVQATSAPAPVPTQAASRAAADAPLVPSFDVVRVEPSGDSVIAGRAAPGATIELLRGDQVHARGVADASGLFAIVPPPLPPGSHQVALQSIAPDGARQRSRESVTVVINSDRTRPLVALTAPDKPTVLLSNPEPPESKTGEAPKAQTKTAEAPSSPETPGQPAAPQQQAGTASPAPASPQAAPRPDIKIVTVDAEEGKLFVSGQSAPGATVRLYLNESFIAPGGAGGDGKVSFSIASGVKPGEYRIRLDDVDPVSGQVKSRSEVGFNVPFQVASAQVQPAFPVSAPQAAPGAQQPQAARTAADTQVAAAGTVVVPSINTALVSRGDNLWRISHRIYGRGVRYTVIYGANQEQIRNPNLIYPGQVFVLPGDQATKSN